MEPSAQKLSDFCLETTTNVAPYYWAKTMSDGSPGCTVEQHGMAAVAVANKIFGALPPQLQVLFPDGWLTLVAVHDVGKISPRFQTLCPMWRGPYGDSSDKQLLQWRMSAQAATEHPHAMCSEWILRRIYHQRKQKGRLWAACVGAHHGTFRDVDVSSIALPDDWMSDAIAFVERMEVRFGALPTLSVKPDEKANVQSLLTGLLAVADWIASSEDCFPQNYGNQDWETLAVQAVRRIGLLGCPPVHQNLSWATLFPHAKSPHCIQQYLWNQKKLPEVCVIEDSMGGGKTEAALGVAYHLLASGQCRGLYFALPTQTTSNRIFSRVADFLRHCGVPVAENTMRLAHSHSWLLSQSLYDDASACYKVKDGQNSAERNLLRWFSSSRRVLLAPFGVGTVDQALMAVLAVKHSAVRSFALAGKVVVLDEVHSYDFYTGTLIALLVNRLRKCGAKVIILSATLTARQCAELLGVESLQNEAYPLVSMSDSACVQTQTFPVPQQKEVSVSVAEVDAVEIAEQAYAAAEKGQCVLWIRNTVQDAQDAYRLLQSERYENGPAVGMLHARYPYWRREQLESEWIDQLGRDATSRPNGCVLVATQVVEQSIDIDADFLITDLAPTDMLLQRIGRLWRHSRPLAQRHAEEPRVLISIPQGVQIAVESGDTEALLTTLGGSGRVYAPYVLLQTWKQWKDRERVLLPADIRGLIEATYQDAQKSDGWEMSLYQEMIGQKNRMIRLASMNASSVAGVMADSEQPPTRYGGVESADVLLLKSPPEMLTPQSWRYVPLCGEPFVVAADTWSFAAAQSIHRNIVRIPAWSIKELKPDPNLQPYTMGAIYACYPLSDGTLLSHTEQETGLGWDARIGVYRLSSLPSTYDEI